MIKSRAFTTRDVTVTDPTNVENGASFKIHCDPLQGTIASLLQSHRTKQCVQPLSLNLSQHCMRRRMLFPSSARVPIHQAHSFTGAIGRRPDRARCNHRHPSSRACHDGAERRCKLLQHRVVHYNFVFAAPYLPSRAGPWLTAGHATTAFRGHHGGFLGGAGGGADCVPAGEAQAEPKCWDVQL